LSPVDPSIGPLLSAMTTQQRIDAINGGPELVGNKYGTDFNGTASVGLNLGAFAMRDGTRGVSQIQGATSPATMWAVAEARAASFDVELERRVGQAQGNEMLALKYDLALAPLVDILQHPAWGRAQEAYGEDPVLVGEMAAAFVNGMQGDHQMMACAKEFALNVSENQRHYMNAVADDQTLYENFIRSFEIMVLKSDPACIMAAYPRVGGLYSTENPMLLTDTLRTELGWKGFTLSEWWATTVGAGAASLNAGLDYEMPDNQAFKTLPTDLSSNAVTVARLNEAVTRMANARFKVQRRKGRDPTVLSRARGRQCPGQIAVRRPRLHRSASVLNRGIAERLPAVRQQHPR
jgi:beta-glucosidase